MKPTAFLSYSATRTYNTSLQRSLLAEVATCMRARGWNIQDPLTSESPDTEGIREKVSSHLHKSDALFAECTMAVPNVMFEIGFARSLKYPMVLFVNREAFDTEAEHLKTHLQFIGLHPDRPLPGDLGDLEYFEYSAEIGSVAGAADFRERLNGLLEKMEQGVLSDGVRLLRRNSLAILREVGEMSQSYNQDHPFLRFIGGWLSQIYQQMTREGRLVFQVDSSAYQNCLSAFQDWKGGKVKAVADLTDTTESFWRRAPDPLKTSVTERIFIVNWNVFFDAVRFKQLCSFLREQSRKYAVRLAHSDGHLLGQQHQFGDDGVGQHLLLMEPNLVGGYVKRSDRRYLRVESNPGLYEGASFQYDLVRDNSFSISHEWTDPEIRRAWMQHVRVGLWNNHWEEVEARSEDYFQHYDKHIRFWIPFYDQLITQASAVVQGEIARMMRMDVDSLSILEIGCGTGALTIPILKWIHNLNSPFSLLKREPPVAHYYGVDRASRMCELIVERLDPAIDDPRLFTMVNGVAMDGLPLIIRPKSCSVIFGSLVLHDLLGEAAGEGFLRLLESSKSTLRNGGSLVFADPFFAADDRQRARQLEYWQRNMMANGLTQSEVEEFLKSNQDMVQALTLDDVRRLAADSGYQCIDPGPLPGPGYLSPFRTLIFRLPVPS